MKIDTETVNFELHEQKLKSCKKKENKNKVKDLTLLSL